MQAANAYFCAGASHHLVLHRYKLWLLADADLLSTRNSYRLCNTGCVATRALLVSCPLVDVSVGHPWCRPAAPAATPARLSADAPSGRMVRSAGCGVAPERGCAQLGGTSEVDAVHEQTARACEYTRAVGRLSMLIHDVLTLPSAGVTRLECNQA